MRALLYLSLSGLLTLWMKVASQGTREYCVIGAGPGGLQMGYFLKKAGRDYMIYERNNVSGSFFQKFPIHRKLISINKVYTGWNNEEFNMRHDWNSLLSDDRSLLVKHYTKEFFPNADVYVEYLKDFTSKHQLNVQYNTNVEKLRKDYSGSEEKITFDDQKGNKYYCKYAVVATGLSRPNKVNIHGAEHIENYEDLTLSKKKYEGKSVLIIGRGNSAFETADHIMGVTNNIHMIARTRIKLSWSTHYVGDLRAINNGLLDTYQLKSLDGLVEVDVEDLALEKRPDGGLHFYPADQVKIPGSTNANVTRKVTPERSKLIAKYLLKDTYDHVIACRGFSFDPSIFHPSAEQETNNNGKYPSIKWTFESRTVPDLYFAGTMTHSLDFRKSSGGFIHGFRYSARTLHNILEWKNHGVPWPVDTHPMKNLVSMVLRRINQASGNYQMFSVLADIYILREDNFELLKEFPIALLPRLEALTGRKADRVVVFLFEYGPDYSGVGKDPFREDRANGKIPENAHEANFLHPHFYYYDGLPSEADMAHKWGKFLVPKPTDYFVLVEEFNTDWRHQINHVLPLRRFFESILGKDLRYRDPETCMKIKYTHRDLPLQCEQMYGLQPSSLNLDILSSYA